MTEIRDRSTEIRDRGTENRCLSTEIRGEPTEIRDGGEKNIMRWIGRIFGLSTTAVFRICAVV